MLNHGKTADVNRADLEAYLEEVVADHVDPLTGEVNTTALVEDAAHYYAREDWLDDDQHIVWDLAVDVAEAHEAALQAFA